MSLFHRHQWERISATYTPPLKDVKSIERSTEEFANRLVFGLTTVVLRCVVCGDEKIIEATGDASAVSTETPS